MHKCGAWPSSAQVKFASNFSKVDLRAKKGICTCDVVILCMCNRTHMLLFNYDSCWNILLNTVWQPFLHWKCKKILLFATNWTCFYSANLCLLAFDFQWLWCVCTTKRYAKPWRNQWEVCDLHRLNTAHIMCKCRCKYAHSGMTFYASRDTCGGPGDNDDDERSPSQLLQI